MSVGQVHSHSQGLRRAAAPTEAVLCRSPKHHFNSYHFTIYIVTQAAAPKFALCPQQIGLIPLPFPHNVAFLRAFSSWLKGCDAGQYARRGIGCGHHRLCWCRRRSAGVRVHRLDTSVHAGSDRWTGSVAVLPLRCIPHLYLREFDVDSPPASYPLPAVLRQRNLLTQSHWTDWSQPPAITGTLHCHRKYVSGSSNSWARVVVVVVVVVVIVVVAAQGQEHADLESRKSTMAIK